MFSKIICFVSAKGGTGKTTTSASVAKLLATLGKEVLLIDMDAATNGLSLFFLDKLVQQKQLYKEEEKTAFGLFEASEINPLTTLPIDVSLDFLPAVYEMKQIKCLADESQFESMFSKTLNGFKSLYNYIIIDTQAGTETYTKIAMELADIVVIVSEFDPISIEGVERFKRLFSEALSPEKTWILINKILPEFTNSLSGILELAKYLPPIPWDADVVRALSRRKSALDTENGNAYTLAILQVVSSLLGDEVKDEIDKWKLEKEDRIKEPVLKQLDEIESKINSLEKVRIDIDYKMRGRQRFPKFALEALIAITAMFISALTLIVFYTNRYPSELFNNKFYSIAIGFMLCAIIFTIYVSRRFEEEAKLLEQNSRYITRKINSLQEDYRKYNTMSKSDLNELIKKKT
jgi:cellulose biosynthesis protein BcsQ